ncbi:MAG: beta-lactamase family protein [Candidatus Delongbacteria bacterium]|nr:beta-lactamase family protein [Candidatus Delongbacteria bacterium]MBN2835724.1 beta-lactamase family protein [Candidatus Delongbacteria bacterium]
MKYEEKISNYLKEKCSESEPGCAIAIIKDDKLIYEKGYGLSNLEHNIPFTPKSMFYIASISKQFTAYCIYLLEQEGLLSFDDSIRNFIPELPVYDFDIKIKHLIHHASGLPDYLTILDIADRSTEQSFNMKEIMELLLKLTELQFKPNERFQYSNTNYILLAEIIERLTGKKLNEFASENIFKPFKMNNTFFNTDKSKVIKNKADGYYLEEKEYKVYRSSFNLVGDGGIWSNIEDLSKWIIGLYEKNILKTQSKLMKFNDDTINYYGLGQFIGEYENYKIVHHGGFLNFYLSDLLNFPEEKLSILCLSNNIKFKPHRITRFIADQFIEKKPNMEFSLNVKNSEKYKNLIGFYSNPQSDNYIKIYEHEDKMYLCYKFDEVMLYTNSSKKIFNQSNNLKWKFEIIEDVSSNNQYQILLNDKNVDKIFCKIKSETYQGKKLKEYTGRYENMKFNAFCELKLENGKLIIQSHNSWNNSITLIDDDYFVYGANNLIFRRNKKNEIIGFMLNNPRAENTVFYDRV